MTESAKMSMKNEVVCGAVRVRLGGSL